MRLFQTFQTFNRFAPFIREISPFQTFESFNRFAPFKALRRFKVQGSRVQRGIEGRSSGSRFSESRRAARYSRVETSLSATRVGGRRVEKENEVYLSLEIRVD